ncbi:MAG: DNA-binding protein [Planctomycetota bacterium]|nr:DNA-binding protein [Planctomycetota bacterium]
MASYRDVTCVRRVMGKCAHEADLLAELTRVCKENGVQLGRVEAIGAVRKARVGYYHQDRREYEFHTFDGPMEIAALVGNVSVKDGEPIVHAHVTLSDATGRAFGGHLAPGTVVFACEFVVEAFDGPEFRRTLDEPTGLPLWNLK